VRASSGADEGVTPDSDGVLRWPIGTLAGNAGGERSVVFTAGANATAPLLVEADVHDGSTHAIITQASAATAVYANPAFAYRLTTTDDDPIVPGRTASFLLTVTNLTNAARDATVYFRVPEFTTYGAFGAGAIRSVAFAAVAAGASQSALLPLVVTSGAAAPPDGTVIALAVDDAERAGTVARAIVTDASGRAELKLSTTQATVAPGGVFAYTSSFHNTQASALFGVELSMPIPAGASFVSADDGVTPGADGVLRWPLGTLAGGAGGKRTVTLAAGAATAAPLLVEAVLRDASADVVAHASADDVRLCDADVLVFAHHRRRHDRRRSDGHLHPPGNQSHQHVPDRDPDLPRPRLHDVRRLRCGGGPQRHLQ
jgi:hypothetical protein